MFIVTTATYPLDKSAEVARTFIKSVETPLPAFVKRLHVLVAAAGESGSKVYTLFEVDPGKEDEGFKEIVRRMVQFYGIEGFRYQIEPVLTAEETIPMLEL